MFDMYVKLPPDASPIAVNKFYLLTYFTVICLFIILEFNQFIYGFLLRLETGGGLLWIR